jgi:pimeloyl-ACP methyl ester carboxylesterase
VKDFPVREDVLILPDGRRLGYGVYGDPAGIPIIDFHGIPGSRREAALIAEFIHREDVCFIGFDRPGYGRSSPRTGFRIPDLPADVTVLAGHLQIDRFIAFGYSGGGPFALACAHQIPNRLAAVGIVSGVGPYEIGSSGMHDNNRKKFNLAQRFPWLARLLLQAAFSPMQRRPEKLEAQMTKIWQQLPEPDRQVLEDDRFTQGILAVTRDAVCERTTGWVNEELLMASAWGFALEQVACPNICLWHGEQDRNVPPAMGRAIAIRLKGCTSAFLAGEGHLSLLYHHGQAIIDSLVKNSRL